jgi:hypothetical protein
MQQSASGNMDANEESRQSAADRETLKELMLLWQASINSDNKEALVSGELQKLQKYERKLYYS